MRISLTISPSRRWHFSVSRSPHKRKITPTGRVAVGKQAAVTLTLKDASSARYVKRPAVHGRVRLSVWIRARAGNSAITTVSCSAKVQIRTAPMPATVAGTIFPAAAGSPVATTPR